MNETLRDKLVSIALEWQEKFGIAPQITTPISEYDAAMLVGFPEQDYSKINGVRSFIITLLTALLFNLRQQKQGLGSYNERPVAPGYASCSLGYVVDEL